MSKLYFIKLFCCCLILVLEYPVFDATFIPTLYPSKIATTSTPSLYTSNPSSQPSRQPSK